MTDHTPPPGFVLQTAHGPVIVTLSGPGYAICEVGGEAGRAHINDERPGFSYRGQDYIGYARLVEVDGTWQIAPGHGYSFSKRPQWTEAPRTHRAAMLGEVIRAVREHLHAHPELAHAAARAEAQRELAAAERELTAAKAAYAAAAERHHRARLAAARTRCQAASAS